MAPSLSTCKYRVCQDFVRVISNCAKTNKNKKSTYINDYKIFLLIVKYSTITFNKDCATLESAMNTDLSIFFQL